jgi:hypothetical protein
MSLNIIKKMHEYLISEPEITKEYLSAQINKNMFDKTLSTGTSSIGIDYLKYIYSSIYYYCVNTWGLIKYNSNPIHISNKNYIKKIVDQNQIEKIREETTNTSRNFFLNTNIVKKNPFMKEIIEKTEKITTVDNDGYYNLTKYVGGFCWVNAKLSNGFEVSEDEQKMINSINSIVDKVEPLSYPVTLFHGFEYYTKYQNYKVGDIVNLKGYVSKTLSLKVAYDFAYSQNNYNPKFLVIEYPVGSKHVHHDIRPFNNEFEFLTKNDEKFKVVNIINYYDIQFPTCTPTYLTFYICKPID